MKGSCAVIIRCTENEMISAGGVGVGVGRGSAGYGEGGGGN